MGKLSIYSVEQVFYIAAVIYFVKVCQKKNNFNLLICSVVMLFRPKTTVEDQKLLKEEIKLAFALISGTS